MDVLATTLWVSRAVVRDDRAYVHTVHACCDDQISLAKTFSTRVQPKTR